MSMPGKRGMQGRLILLAGVVLFALPLLAQLQLNGVSMTGNGTFSAGYSGGYTGLSGGSSHGITLGGNANIDGDYFNPQFLSFHLMPYYNRDQSNSASRSIEDSSGVDGTVDIFSGSHIPGSVSFSKDYNSTGSFGIPGTAGLVTHGNGTGLNINWSALFPGLPTLTAAYSKNNSTTSVYGSQNTAESSFQNLSFQSTYNIAGYNLNGTYSHASGHSQFPELLVGTTGVAKETNSSNNYQVSASHSIPFRGQFQTQYTRLGYHYDYGEQNSSQGSSNTINSIATISPFKTLGASIQGDYTDDVAGGLEQEILSSTGQTILINGSTNSGHAIGAQVYYNPSSLFGVTGQVQHAVQTALGRTYSLTTYGASAISRYSRPFLGSFTFSGGLLDSANQAGNSVLGGVANVNFSRKMFGWDVQSNFGYSQNVQTVLVIETTSSMSYSASIHRKMAHRKFLNLGFSGGHSGLSQQSGDTSHQEQFFGNFNYHNLSFSGNYSKNFGTSIYTAAGLVVLPGNLPPSIFSPNALAVTSGTSYSFGMGTTLMRRLIVTSSYASSRGTTLQPTNSLQINNSLANVLLTYRLRRLYITGGYTRLLQTSQGLSNTQSRINTFFIGISRWFNLF
jgi:hypothetical protein